MPKISPKTQHREPGILTKIEQCQFCSYSHDDELYVLTHEVLLHSGELFHYISNNIRAYKRYRRSSHCKLCGISIGGLKQHAKHFAGHISSYQFKCQVCTMTYMTPNHLMKHTRFHHKNGSHEDAKFLEAIKSVTIFLHSGGIGHHSAYSWNSLINNNVNRGLISTGFSLQDVTPPSVVEVITVDEDDEKPSLTSVCVVGQAPSNPNNTSSDQLMSTNVGITSSDDNNTSPPLYQVPTTELLPTKKITPEVSKPKSKCEPVYSQTPDSHRCQTHVNKFGMSESVASTSGSPPPVMYCPACPFACNDKDTVIRHMSDHLTKC